MSCEHIPKKGEFKLIDKQKIIKECQCGSLCEFVCMTCQTGLCETCREKHDHPVSVGTATGYCNKCKKEILVEEVKEFYDSLPAF